MQKIILSLLILLSSQLMADFEGAATPEKITEILVDLSKQPIGESGSWGGAIAIIDSNRSERYAQFYPLRSGLINMEIPIASSEDIFLTDDVVERLKDYLKGWKLQPEVSKRGGVYVDDGSTSSWRIMDVELKISPSDYPKFINGLFLKCFGEKEPLDLTISYAPEG
ncbi:hypothetical protein [Cerasicoccus maritimus]|uniref:hypothetical protein n=1 Tax=Cerasicoccus maritimus TaxID=490089 RepID=UPI0028526F5A|nr:hypothetical protein [Cerasicoccus maritimus]